MDERTTHSRRDFIKATAVAGTTLAATRLSIPEVHAAGSDEIRIGLIGCGGRGTGAVMNAFEATKGVRLVAVGDAFADRIEAAKKRWEELGEAAVVPKESCFVGLDAYEKVIASDVNYIILATPPGFRPPHLKAAVAAGKHIFTEKPVAVDAPGIRECLAIAEESEKKGLAIGAGTQRRHQKGYLEVMKRVHDGAIGELRAARAYWNQGGLWNKARQRGWSDLEWQMRNWLYLTWLSGDHIVEQHVHNIDVVNWAMGAHPVSAEGMGGRQSRISNDFGMVFDHFAIDYAYENGAHMMSMCRQVPDCANRVAETIVGSTGSCETDSGANRYVLTGANRWRFREEAISPYVQEHIDLIESIRSGSPINELKQVSESTFTAIMGRMSAYTGKAMTWDEALASDESLVPEGLSFDGSLTVPPVPRPGVVT
jgi:myo-inositol 2-dehydrogenase/D-chiro-inositol 1-dehydrogenase